jgi:hypothetical protein
MPFELSERSNKGRGRRQLLPLSPFGKQLRSASKRIIATFRAFELQHRFGPPLRPIARAPEHPIAATSCFRRLGGTKRVGVEPDLAGVFAQKTRSNAMERPRPGKSIAHYTSVRADHLPAYSFDAPGHLGCRPA